MAQRKQLSWTELKVGLFVLAGLVILMVGIFYVTGAGFLGPKYRLITYLPEVEGVKPGAPVDLDGVEIGNVQSIDLTPRPQDREHSITVVLRIDKRYQKDIRTDSQASLVTEGLLGNRYVSITRGLTGTSIPQNGVIPGGEQQDVKAIVQRGADVVQNLSVLSQKIGQIVEKVNNGEGTIGKVINDPSLYNHLDDTMARVDSMAKSIQAGQGSIGKLVATDDLYQKADSAIGKVDDTLGAIHDQEGTVGKLIYDPTMYNSIKSIGDKGNGLLDDIHNGKGTIGKLATDDSLFTNLRQATVNVRDASAKLNSNQGTLGKFFSDPALYDNLTGLTGDMRLLIGDFRQNPKKFLHIKLGVF